MLKYLAVLILMIFLAQMVAIVLFFNQISEMAQDSTLSPFEMLSQYKYILLTYQMIPIISISCVGFYFFNKFTNRIVGPIFNINRIVKRINAGEVESAEIKLRDGDYFKEFANDLNTLIKSKHS
jgi:hypothetical protein